MPRHLFCWVVGAGVTIGLAATEVMPQSATLESLHARPIRRLFADRLRNRWWKLSLNSMLKLRPLQRRGGLAGPR
jgi:hypothetical protein